MSSSSVVFVKSFSVAWVAVVVILTVKSLSSAWFSNNRQLILEDKWWGKGPQRKENAFVTHANISVDDDVLDDLNYRLHHTKPFHPSMEGMYQYYGTHTTLLNEVLNYWKHSYNFTERLPFLNQYTHSFVTIRGLKLHFLHVRPHVHSNVTVVPLLLLHGWPGSVREFYEAIPLLTAAREDKTFVFEVVAPSLPGFAFSESTTTPGLSAVYMGQMFADLMQILGFRKYYVQGGDWGSTIAQSMSVFFPERMLGIHINMCFINTFFSHLQFFIGEYLPSLIYEPEEVALCSSTGNSLKFLIGETGYFHLQATKPDTIGVALRESPIGLAAYMLEKFSTLTNTDYQGSEDGGLTKKFTMEQLLDNVMIYWITGSMTSAMRIYAESFTNYQLEMDSFNKAKVYVPTGCARFRHEILLTPRSILKERFKNLIHLTHYDQGGHFAALEEPDLFVADIFEFVQKVENARKN